MDAANILKPALARGELRTIGATTLDEYQKYFRERQGFGTPFPVGLCGRTEHGRHDFHSARHSGKIRELPQSANPRRGHRSRRQLSHRYISERKLPDKAIDLIDEAAAKLRLELDSVPEDVDKLDRQLRQLEIEREAIKREKDERKLDAMNKQIQDVQEKLDGLREPWQSEKEIVEAIQNCKQKLEELQIQYQKAERGGIWKWPRASNTKTSPHRKPCSALPKKNSPNSPPKTV